MGLKKVLLLGLMVMLVSQMFLVEGNKQREGKKDREGKEEKGKPRGEAKEEGNPSPINNGKGKGSKGGKSSLQGKFKSKDQSECVWSVSGTETVAVNIDCAKGESRVSCTFGGNPTACPSYARDQKSYWKQITRALRKQKNLCQDQKAVLKSKICKTGPKEAHLSYIIPSMPASGHEPSNHGHVRPTPTINTHNKDCDEDPEAVDSQRIAKEYCSDTWSTLCTFLFSMVQSKSC